MRQNISGTTDSTVAAAGAAAAAAPAPVSPASEVKPPCAEGRHYACGYKDCCCDCHSAKKTNEEKSVCSDIPIGFSDCVYNDGNCLFSSGYDKSRHDKSVLVRLLILWFGAFVYTFPARLAFKHQKTNRIAFLRLICFWLECLVGWVVALTWALTKEQPDSKLRNTQMADTTPDKTVQAIAAGTKLQHLWLN